MDLRWSEVHVGDEVWDVRLDVGEGFLMIDFYGLMMLRQLR